MKKGPVKHQEGRVLGRWRACSRMEKGMFLKGVGQWGEASVAVRFCDIGWLNVSVDLCVFCSSVSFCEKKNIFETRRGVLSLTERTEFTEHFFALFRAHRRPPAYRVHRALLLKVAVRFCEIGWLNVSVGLCVFCSSVFFCEKKNNCETRRGVLSLTERTEFTEVFGAHFELTEGLRHTENTERFSYRRYR